MERFTRKMPGGYGLVDGRQLGTVKNNRAIINRLAAYENCGLEPEQVDKLVRLVKIAHLAEDILGIQDDKTGG